MKDKILKIAFLFIINLNYSQQHIVVDSLSKKPLSFVTIKLPNSGFYTNEEGKFNLLEKSTDTIYISCLGYKTFKASSSNIKDTILLSPMVEVLNEVVLSNNKNSSILIGSLNKNTNYSAILHPKSEFVTLIKPSEKYSNMYLDKIHIPSEKYFTRKQKNNPFKNTEGVFKLNVYSVKNDLPKNKIYSTPGIKFNMNENETFTLDISDQLLKLPKEGLYIGIEMLGYIDENGNFIDTKNNSYLRLPFTKKPSKDFTTTTYYKYIFSEVEKLIPLSNLSQTAQNYSIIIGLTLSK